MRESQFFLAGVDSNSNVIILSSPSNRNEATRIQNGVYVKTYGSASFRDVKTHKMLNGERTLHHAWLWIMRNDGICFWVDPTWTDNLGYVVYGYIANGEEMQLRPDEKYCIDYPDYLKNLPAPPKWGKKLAPSTSTTTSSTSTSYSSSNSSKPIGAYFSFGYTGSFNLENETESSFLILINMVLHVAPKHYQTKVIFLQYFHLIILSTIQKKKQLIPDLWDLTGDTVFCHFFNHI